MLHFQVAASLSVLVEPEFVADYRQDQEYTGYYHDCLIESFGGNSEFKKPRRTKMLNDGLGKLISNKKH